MRELQEQVDAFQRDAEQAREEAERNLQQVARELRVRLRDVPPDALEWVAAPPSPPAAPEAPAPPVADAPLAPPPPAPPWRFWFGTGEEADPRDAARVVSDVRQAIVDTLESRGAAIAAVRPQEYVSIAVDFTPSVFVVDFEGPQPERTLVLRVRKRDLDERHAGRLKPEELRQRIEALEY
jgi:hypothetical protein